MPKAGTGGVSPMTDIGHASYAWRFILNGMQTGMTVKQAVDIGNDELRKAGKSLQLEVVGDKTTTIR